MKVHGLFITIGIGISVFGAWFLIKKIPQNAELPYKVGILHSLSGTMSISETAVADATSLAIDRINQAGGISGRKIEAIKADGRSDWPTFAREAERLIRDEKVDVVFGCWTSASRKTVKPIFEKYDHLLFYPVQYEGLEQSPNIVYTGAAPNQQITPAVKWSFDNLGKRFFLVGSDYVFPRTANAIVQDFVTAQNGEVVGEEYILLGSKEVEDIVQKIVETKPDVILNTINGDSNVAFFNALRQAGITPDSIPVMSFSIAETELQSMDIENLVGHFACWNYFESIDNDLNHQFVNEFKKAYGQDKVVADPMEAAYIAVHLWAQAVQEIGTANITEVRQVLRNQSFNAPEGLVYVDAKTQHLWKTVRIGKISKNSQFEVVWDSQKPVQPMPYPGTRSRAEWNAFLHGLYEGWDQSWANPGKK